MQLPANVSVDKRNKPKGWSHPVQTTELLSLIEIANVTQNVRLLYLSSIKRSNSFLIIEAKYYGKAFASTGHADSFAFQIMPIRSELRQAVNAIVLNEFGPIFREWMKRCQPESRSLSLTLRYYWSENVPDHRAFILEDSHSKVLRRLSFDLFADVGLANALQALEAKVDKAVTAEK